MSNFARAVRISSCARVHIGSCVSAFARGFRISIREHMIRCDLEPSKQIAHAGMKSCKTSTHEELLLVTHRKLYQCSS